MSRAYLKRATAAHAAERWGLSAFRFVNGAAWARAAPGNRPRAPPERPVDAARASTML